MFGDLIRGEVDILPCSLYLTPTRVVSADFLIPLGYDSMTLFVWTGGAGDGEAGRIDVGTFAMPFTPQLWAALAFIALAITASAVLQRIYQVDQKNMTTVSLLLLSPGPLVLWLLLLLLLSLSVLHFLLLLLPLSLLLCCCCCCCLCCSCCCCRGRRHRCLRI